MGFKKLDSDTCLYVSERRGLYIILYVDNVLIFGKDIKEITWVKDNLSKRFKMKDLGEVRNFLGLDIRRDLESGWMILSQERYISKILDKFKMPDCNPVSTPIDAGTKWKKPSGQQTSAPFKALLGCLLYLTLMSRPDITFAVSLFSRFQSNPDDTHWTGLKRILRYLKGTRNLCLVYRRMDTEAPLAGYADADFANDEEDRRSVSGNAFTVYGNLVSWSTKRQQLVSLSSTEAELVSLCAASKEGIWLSKMLCEVGILATPFTMFEDNIPCIKIAEEPRDHQRTKHIDVKYMFIREQIQNKKIILKYVPSENQVADVFTKPLVRTKFM